MMAEKKWYSMEDVERAKISIEKLPDLKPARLTKADVLDQLKEKIIELSDSKGYSVEDIRSALSSAGIQTSIKSIRELLNTRQKNTKRTISSKLKTTQHTDKAPNSEPEKTLEERN